MLVQRENESFVLSFVLVGGCVLGCIFQCLAKSVRCGSLLVFGLFLVVPSALAQQAPIGEQLLAADGTLIPDSDRSGERADVDLFDEPTQRPPARVFEPQDPLNNIYANSSTSAIDRRDNERVRNSLRDPLNQAPRNFRDDRFLQRLARQQQQAGDVDWRTRDDTAFDPLGKRVGGFIFYPELYAGLITTNNLFATKSLQQSDRGLRITPTFRLRSDWNNHELEFLATSTHTRWHEFSSENTDEVETRLRGRIDITKRTSVEGGFRYELKAEGRGSNELPDSAANPANVHEVEFFGQLNHRFNRLGFRLRGRAIRNIHDDVELNSGAIQANHIRDYDGYSFELRTNYEFSPRFSLFADTGVGKRVFKTKVDGGGFKQGSKSWLAAVGTSVEFTSSLSFLGRVGYTKASPDEQSLVDLSGVVYDAALIWKPTRLATVTLKGKTDIEETTQTGSPGSINRSVSLEFVNSWTHRLTSTVTGEYEVSDYAGIDQTDKELIIGLGIEYLFNRSWVLDTGFKHTRVEGSNKYNENEFRLGLKWRR